MPEQEELKPIARNADAERGVMREHLQNMREGRQDEVTQDLLNEVQTVHADMIQNGVIPATIVNLNPFKLTAQGPHLADIEVPPCEATEGFSYFVIDTYKVDIQDKGGRYGARAITPIVLAKDFVAQQKQFKRGGVFCYIGDIKPGSKKLPDEQKRQMEQARSEMFATCKKLVEEAQAEWSRPNGSGKLNVDDRHRKAFQTLKAYKLWGNKSDPEWVAMTRDEKDVLEPCPSCGVEPMKGAFQCKVCAYILDPIKAYKLGEISVSHQSLKRLTKEQLVELGLYGVVLPLAEAQAADIKALKAGK